jgi:hypothetical protein
MQSIGHQKGFFTSESEMKWLSPTHLLTSVLLPKLHSLLFCFCNQFQAARTAHTLPHFVRSSLLPMSRSEIPDLEEGYYWDSLVERRRSGFMVSSVDNSSSVLSGFLHFQNGPFLRPATIFGNITPLVPQSWSSLLRSHSHICLEPD